MKTMLFAAAALGGALLSAAPVIEKLDYPETVRAGEPFALSVTVSGTGDAPASCSFNGETRLIPPNLHHYAAGKLAAKYSKIEADGAVTAGSDYHTLLSFPLPQDGKSYTVWVRASGGALCLRRPEKELKWSFGRSGTFRWINFGSWNRAQAGPTLALMSEKTPYVRVERILLTTAPAAAYRPAGDGSAPNRFVWVPGVSAVGRHRFEVTVSAARTESFARSSGRCPPEAAAAAGTGVPVSRAGGRTVTSTVRNFPSGPPTIRYSTSSEKSAGRRWRRSRSAFHSPPET